MADQPIEEVADLVAERVGLGVELLEGLCQAVGDLHVAAFEFAYELDVVVAR